MYPHERTLVKEMQGRPFVLLGVNTDGELSTAQGAIAENKLNWRSFYDGRGGSITQMFNIRAFPTIMLIDHRGVIQHDSIRQELDDEIERLVSVAESAGMVGDKIKAEFRTFRDKTGKHKIEAKAEATDGTSVVLRKEDNSTVTIALENLSKADRRYLKTVDMKPMDSAADAGESTVATTDSAWRTFRDSTGKFEIEAQLVGVSEDKAVLKKRDGSEVKVPVSKLSSDDREYIEQQRGG